MVSQELLDYIKQQLQQGMDEDAIRGSLVSSGWRATDIAEAFSTSKQNSIGPAQSPRFHKWILLTAFIIGIILIIGGVAGYFFLDKSRAIGSNRSTSSTQESSYLPIAGQVQNPSNKEVVNTVEVVTDISQCDTQTGFPKDSFFDKRVKGQCILEIAIKSGSMNLCPKIEDEEFNSECYSNFAAKKKDISICEKIPGLATPSVTGKGMCRYHAAVVSQDLLLCNTLPDEHRSNFGKDACYKAIAEDKKDYSICNQIPEGTDFDSGDYKYECIRSVASMKGECEVIPKQVGRDYCYLYQSNSMRVTARDNRCDVYEEPMYVNLCKAYVRGEITLQAVCNKIIDPVPKQECLTYDISNVSHDYGTGETIITNPAN